MATHTTLPITPMPITAPKPPHTIVWITRVAMPAHANR